MHNSCFNYLSYLRDLWWALHYSLWSPEYFLCFLYGYLQTCKTPTMVYLRFVILSSEMFPLHFFSLSTISWIDFSAPLSIARLIFSHFILFWPLSLVASLPCCSILDPDLVSEFYAERNIRYPQKICPRNFSMSSTQPPLFGHVGNLSRRQFCSPNTFVLWYADTSPFSWVTYRFLPIWCLITLRNGHWWLVTYRKIWAYFRFVGGKRPLKYPLWSVFQPPRCTRCVTPISL